MRFFYFVLCALLVASFVLFSCGGKEAPAVKTPTKEVLTLETPSSSFPVVNNKGKGSAAAPKPVGDYPETTFLTSQFIVVDRCINSNDPAWAKRQRGQWFRFDKSGSMVIGKWEEQLTQGSWFLVNNKNKGRRFLFIDAEDDSFDGEWEIQGMSDTNGEMVMVKSELYERKNIHLKVMQLLTVPTKDQFGLTE